MCRRNLGSTPLPALAAVVGLLYLVQPGSLLQLEGLLKQLVLRGSLLQLCGLLQLVRRGGLLQLGLWRVLGRVLWVGLGVVLGGFARFGVI